MMMMITTTTTTILESVNINNIARKKSLQNDAGMN
jgi:hypothetical protein